MSYTYGRGNRERLASRVRPNDGSPLLGLGRQERPCPSADVRWRAQIIATNLVLVCARHHTLIRSQGFRLVLHPDRRLDVSIAEEVPLLYHPAQLWGDPAALAHGCGQLVSAEALPPDNVEARLDLGYVVSVLMAQAA